MNAHTTVTDCCQLHAVGFTRSTIPIVVSIMPYGLLTLLLPTYLRTAQGEPMPDIIISLAAGVEPGSLPRHGATPPPLEVAFWWRLGVSVLLVLLGGIFAGLTLGLMGLDELRLRVLAESGEVERDRVNAAKGEHITIRTCLGRNE
jgi:hypothetical protein